MTEKRKRAPGGGRKSLPPEKRKDKRRLYRWSENELKLITDARTKTGESEAEFVQKAVLEKAKEIIGGAS